MIWEVDIFPREGQPNREADRAAADIRELHLAETAEVAAARGYLLQGNSLTAENVTRIADELLVDRVVEEAVVAPVGDERLNAPVVDDVALDQSAIRNPQSAIVHVLPKPGVMDPVALSAVAAIADCGVPCDTVRTLRKYWIAGVAPETLLSVCNRVLANEAVEQTVVGPLTLEKLDTGGTYRFEKRTVSLDGLDDDGLMRLSLDSQLYLQLAEMQTIQRYYADLGRDPTDVELETIAQTWSEHCSHKTLAGRIAYREENSEWHANDKRGDGDGVRTLNDMQGGKPSGRNDHPRHGDVNGERTFDNMLKETIFAATRKIRERLGDDDWCVSVFKDNAGVIRFDDENNLAFKVETHNHPSALDPYGGANTGIGGVIRDILGTGMGAKPIASTDVFCFAPPETPSKTLPPGVLHPRRIMRGVVEGVRDYGNRMGIPTVNGAIYFDPRYLGNPLVYCGSLGILPHDMSFKEPKPGDAIVVLGGRTGRDGIHGATFSSAELTSESEDVSGGAVQIGNAIEEKKVLDVLLTARDRGFYNAVTDCGAGGFSSAVGEMGEEIGAEVWLDRAPLKYDGLSYTEIWISEAQERMVFAVGPENVDAMITLSESEGVEAFVLGEFTPTGRLVLKYNDQIVGDLPMDFLHNGRPPVVRKAVYAEVGSRQQAIGSIPQSAIRNPQSTPGGQEEVGSEKEGGADYTDDLLAILGSLNVASKEWVIRQYDHEVQGGSVVKPLVGAGEDGPSDAAVLRPVLGSRRGAVIACGMNPLYGDLDPGCMAASAIDEAVRNCVAAGADPDRIALLDNFCWGDCEREETLGSLVRAAVACHDTAVVLGTPFISGKDSLNNEFSYTDETTGERRTIAIPATLLISAVGQIDDASKCVTMDLKTPGNLLYLVGLTKNEMGGSHYMMARGNRTGNPLASGRSQLADGVASKPPSVDAPAAKRTFAAIHAAMNDSLVRSCHDLSEGGLAASAAETCFAGDLGAEIDLSAMPCSREANDPSVLLFSESNTRFLCEVPPDQAAAFEKTLAGIPHAKIGSVTEEKSLRIVSVDDEVVIDADISQLKQAWQEPLAW